MKISVVIPTLSRPDDLKLALESILSQTVAPNEVVIVDQSPDARTRLLASRMRNSFHARLMELRYVRQSQKSLVKARNAGLAKSIGDIVTFLDDDVELFDDYFEKLLKAFERDERVGGVSGNTLIGEKPSGVKWNLRQALMKMFLISNFDGKMTRSGFGFPIYEREISQPIEVEMLPGCNMSFRRDYLVNDRFDEWFSGYAYREDAEFSYRISKMSKLVMIPEAKLYHHHSPASRMNLEALKKMEVKNYHYFFKKHAHQNVRSLFLFNYSLLGLNAMNFIEFLTNRTRDKYQQLRGTLLSSLSLWFNQTL